MDCNNLRETSQKMIVDTFAPGVRSRNTLRRRRGSKRTKKNGEKRRHRSRAPVSIWDGIIQ